MKPVMSEETRRVVEAMEEATWNAIDGYRQTGLPVPVWRDGKVAYLTVDEALAGRPDLPEPHGDETSVLSDAVQRGREINKGRLDGHHSDLLTTYQIYDFYRI